MIVIFEGIGFMISALLLAVIMITFFVFLVDLGSRRRRRKMNAFPVTNIENYSSYEARQPKPTPLDDPLGSIHPGIELIEQFADGGRQDRRPISRVAGRDPVVPLSLVGHRRMVPCASRRWPWGRAEPAAARRRRVAVPSRVAGRSRSRSRRRARSPAGSAATR